MKVLILCTGNSCRSQMAQGFLRAYRPTWEVFSAGVEPADRVHPLAVQVMAEEGIDLSGTFPRDVRELVDNDFDYVITVCDGAREQCPVFAGSVKHRLHMGFQDPAMELGCVEHLLSVFRRIRDEIKRDFRKFADSVDATTTAETLPD